MNEFKLERKSTYLCDDSRGGTAFDLLPGAECVLAVAVLAIVALNTRWDSLLTTRSLLLCATHRASSTFLFKAAVLLRRVAPGL